MKITKWEKKDLLLCTCYNMVYNSISKCKWYFMLLPLHKTNIENYKKHIHMIITLATDEIRAKKKEIDSP